MLITIIGLISGFGVVILSIFLHTKDTIVFLNLPAALITIGGTLSSILIYFSFFAIKEAGSSFLAVFKYNQIDIKTTIDTILKIDKEVRYTDVIDLLNSDIVEKNSFLYKGLTLVADNVQPKEIQSILARYSNSLTTKRQVAERVFSVAGSLAPMFGMTGTVIGLISMLSKISEPSAIPAAMGLALITTLYGLLLSALFFIPLSGKIGDLNLQETRIRQVIIEGMLSIQQKENPQVLQERLDGYLIYWERDRESKDNLKD